MGIHEMNGLPSEPDGITQRGLEILERVIRPRLTPEDDGKYIAIDVNSGQWSLDASDAVAVGRLPASESLPRQILMVRAGPDYKYPPGRGPFGRRRW